jgi:hypothetical protein
VFAEELLTLSEASKRLPKLKAGKPPHVSTLHRWVLRGCRSQDDMVVRLETVKIGGTTCTSLEALQRFFDRLSGDTTVVTPPTPTMRKRQRQLDRVDEELRKAGF